MADPHELPYSSTQIEQGLSRAISPDSSPTAASSNLVSSGGIKSALDTKADGSTVTALDGRVTALESPNNTITTVTSVPGNISSTSPNLSLETTVSPGDLSSAITATPLSQIDYLVFFIEVFTGNNDIINLTEAEYSIISNISGAPTILGTSIPKSKNIRTPYGQYKDYTHFTIPTYGLIAASYKLKTNYSSITSNQHNIRVTLTHAIGRAS